MSSEQELADYHRKLAIYEEQMKNGWESKPYNEFLDLVTDRLAPELDHEKPICPFCNDTKVRKDGRVTTLIGQIGDGPDPNHQWVNCTCESCNKSWTMEIKGEDEHGYNVWYTKDGKILKGLPTCFEAYRYTCKQCSGDIVRHNYDKGTRQTSQSLWYDGDGNKSFDTYFRCDGCGVEVQCSNEYYCYSSPHHPRKPFNPDMSWCIYEEMGTVVINDYAIDRVEIRSD